MTSSECHKRIHTIQTKNFLASLSRSSIGWDHEMNSMRMSEVDELRELPFCG